jgi:hypothetical protein
MEKDTIVGLINRSILLLVKMVWYVNQRYEKLIDRFAFFLCLLGWHEY